MPSFIAENENEGIERIMKIARQSASELENSKIDADLNQILADIDEKLSKDTDKSNAFELGRNIMIIETAAVSGKVEKFNSYMDKILSNPLLNKVEEELKQSEDSDKISDKRERLRLYLNDIDNDLVDYVEFGVQVEASKYESVKSEFEQTKLKDIADKLEFPLKDIEKYNKYFQSIQSEN